MLDTITLKGWLLFLWIEAVSRGTKECDIWTNVIQIIFRKTLGCHGRLAGFAQANFLFNRTEKYNSVTLTALCFVLVFVPNRLCSRFLRKSPINNIFLFPLLLLHNVPITRS